MSMNFDMGKITNYFSNKLSKHGATHLGVDYNSVESQEIRFNQLLKIADSKTAYSILDFGSGYGGLYDFLVRSGSDVDYIGYDIALTMVAKGRELHPNNNRCTFTEKLEAIPVVDYAIASGTFNMKLDADVESWTHIVIEGLNQMNKYSSKGMAFNMLTKYSDLDRMRPDLYYGDPCLFFDYCKRNFSKNVALLHDYDLYDFTILVRKD